MGNEKLWDSGLRIVLPGMIFCLLCAPAFAQSSHQADAPGFVQQNLRSDEVMLEYFLTDSSVLVNAIAVDSTLLAQQSLNALFWASLKSFQKKLRSADPNEFSILGQVLYLFLIDPVKDFLNGKRRLIIIPGSKLAGLPFEAFVLNDQSSPPYNICDIHYLIRDYEIVYHCSSVCWADITPGHQDEHTADPGDSRYAFLGFSPGFSNYRGVSALPGSQVEVAAIGSLFKQKGLACRTVSGQNSEKGYFKSMACRGKIVHLATHFLHDKENPGEKGFLFWGYDLPGRKDKADNGFLSAEEIPALHLEADLVVLNACSSGTGLLKPDDPESSLPCVFFTAGARNILSTLWSVNDDLTGKFMISFYRRWLSGKTYSEALREVKLYMISRPETALPTIWAPYVLTGH